MQHVSALHAAVDTPEEAVAAVCLTPRSQVASLKDVKWKFQRDKQNSRKWTKPDMQR